MTANIDGNGDEDRALSRMAENWQPAPHSGASTNNLAASGKHKLMSTGQKVACLSSVSN
jgi:hypothetical protein